MAFGKKENELLNEQIEVIMQVGENLKTALEGFDERMKENLSAFSKQMERLETRIADLHLLGESLDESSKKNADRMVRAGQELSRKADRFEAKLRKP